MPIFTKEAFTTLTEKRAASRGKTLYSVLNEARVELKTSTKIGIFLSHSHKDKGLIKQAISFLRQLMFLYMLIG